MAVAVIMTAKSPVRMFSVKLSSRPTCKAADG
jgi:hypothetical protein